MKHEGLTDRGSSHPAVKTLCTGCAIFLSPGEHGNVTLGTVTDVVEGSADPAAGRYSNRVDAIDVLRLTVAEPAPIATTASRRLTASVTK